MGMKDIQRSLKFGAKPKLSVQETKELVRNFEAPGCSESEIAEHYGISRASVYRLYRLNRQQQAS